MHFQNFAEAVSLIFSALGLIHSFTSMWRENITPTLKLVSFLLSTGVVVALFFAINTKEPLPRIELVTCDNINNRGEAYWDSSWAGAWGNDRVWVCDGIAFQDQQDVLSPRQTAYWFSYSDQGGIRFPSRLPVVNDSALPCSTGTSIMLRWLEAPPSVSGKTWTACVFGLGNGKPTGERDHVYNTFDLTQYDNVVFHLKGQYSGELLVRLEDDCCIDGTPSPNSTNSLQVGNYFQIKGKRNPDMWTMVKVPLSHFDFSVTAFPQNRNKVDRTRIKQVSFSSTEGEGAVLVSAIAFDGTY